MASAGENPELFLWSRLEAKIDQRQMLNPISTGETSPERRFQVTVERF